MKRIRETYSDENFKGKIDFKTDKDFVKFTNTISKRLLLLLHTIFTNISINKIENAFLAGNITKHISKIREPMLRVLMYIAMHGGCTEKLLTVEEIMPQQTVNWCLKYLEKIKVVRSASATSIGRGRPPQIYYIDPKNIQKVEAMHDRMNQRIRKTSMPKTEPKGKMFISDRVSYYKCQECGQPYGRKIEQCKCGSTKLKRMTSSIL